MIKYNLNNINDWNFGEDNIIKVYRNNAVCYYKITSGDTPVQEPCFAVVDNISQYSETEFEDVFNKADDKWYKLNNLNQYEEYGVYASGRTSCEGSSRLPQGYTEVEYVENTSTAYIDTGAYLDTSNFEIGYVIGNKQQLFGYCHQGCGSCTWLGVEQSATMWWGNFNNDANISSYLTSGDNTIIFTQSGATINGTSISKTLSIGSDNISNVSLPIFARYDFKNNVVEHRTDSYMQLKSFYLKNNGILVRDFVPCKRDSDDKYGMYDIVNDVFYLSPNNVDFSGGDPIAPTDCVTTYEGKLTVDDGYEYIYSGGSWVNLGEVTGSTATLPDVPFVLNYNAKNYDATTHSIPMTTGQLNAIDAVITGTTANIIDHHEDGYIQLTGSTSTEIRALVGTTNFSRSSSSPNITIICKAYTPDSSTEGNILSNRKESYNWMYRHKSTQLRFHGQSEQGSIAVSNTVPNTCSVRIDSNRLLKYNNWTQNTTSTSSNFNYGSNSNGGALFSGYYSNAGEYWKGVFYWIYMSLNTLTDEQVQQVIAYNEGGGGGQTEYPLEYVVREDPPNNLVFSSMTEAEDYECPWVGMKAKIDGDNYVFSGDSQSGYEWVYNSSRLPVGYTEVEYIQNTGTSYLDTNFVPNQDTRIVADMQLVTLNDYPRLFGAGGWNAADGINVDYEGGYLLISWFGKTSWTQTTLATNYNRHIYDLNKNYLYVDDTLLVSNTYTTKTASDNLAVFAYIRNGRPTTSNADMLKECFKGKLWSFQIYDNGTLVRDLVPCIKDSDNTVGAYDIVNDVFYTVPTGYTTDKLVAGSPV